MPADRPDFTPSPELYPFESHWFESSVGAVHYIDEGPRDQTAPTILFFHGNPTWSFLYRHIVLALREDCRCIAMDYPGFGLSVRPDGYGYTPGEHARVALELVDSLELERYWIMGQDWGGPIAMWVATEHPDWVRGLIFGNTWWWPTSEKSMRVFSLLMSSLPVQWAIRRRNFFVKPMMPTGMSRKLSRAEKEHYAMAQPEGMREGVAVFPREIRGAKRWLEQLERRVVERVTDLPLLLVWGMKDFAFKPKKFVPRWQETFPDVRLVELPKAKHYIQEDAPEEISAAIRSLITETQGANG